MQLVKYVQGLGWTQEQLVVLTTAALALVLCIALIRALKRAFIRRDQVSELRTEVERLHSEVESLLNRLAELESDSDDDAESEAVSQCLTALETGFPQHDSECAKAAMSVLLQHAATHPDRNQGVWQALIAKVDRLVEDVVDRIASDPETTKLIERRAQEMLADVVASMNEDASLRASAERVFRGVLAGTEEALLKNPTAAMTTAMEVALKDMMQPWLDDEDDEDIKDAAIRVFTTVLKLTEEAISRNPSAAMITAMETTLNKWVQAWLDNGDDDDINEAATRVFRVVLELVETRLSADSAGLSSEFCSALIERVKELIGSDDVDIGELACKVVETRGSALLEDGASRFGEVDETIVSAVTSHVEDNDFEEAVEKLARTVVDSRTAVLTTKPPEDLVATVDEQVTSGVERWLEDNPDEVAPSVERLAKAVLGTEATALVATPPDDVVETVREKITDAVDEQLEELTEEISNAARDVAKAAIARSSQAS